MLRKLIALGVPKLLSGDFALTPHPTKRWCKKIRGKVWFFGSFADGWQKALDTYREQIEDILAGRTPAARNKDGLRLLDLCNQFMHFKRSLLQTGELTLLSWRDYHSACERIMDVLGRDRLVEDLGPNDFAKLRQSYGTTWGMVRIGNEINKVRILLKYAVDAGLIDKVIRSVPRSRSRKRVPSAA